MNDFPILVVGVGALGSEVCRQLAQKKFTHVLIVDPDRLEEHNVRCSLIYQSVALRRGIKAFSEFKANLLLDEVNRCFALNWKALTEEIADVEFSHINRTQLILSCTDSALARIETTRVARVLGIPMIDGGVKDNEIAAGRATWFATNREAACYLCGISEKRRAEILSYAASASLSCRASEEFPSMTGNLDAVYETASTMISFIQQWKMANAPFDRSFAVQLQLDTAKEWSQVRVSLPQSATCPWHDEEVGVWCPIQEDRPIREAFTEEKLCLELLWPQCLVARCLRCGARSEPLRRITWVRRKAICAVCGAKGSCEPIEVINVLTSADRRANLTPRQLGLSKRHLYFFRPSFVPATKGFQ